MRLATGSLQVTSHSRYDLPYRYRWDDVYRTSDPFNAVYNWYSVGFELGAESKAMGSCILLEGSSSQLTAQRIMTVFLCDTPAGRSIYVTRSTSLR
jgi:hypothetical protein